MKKFPTFSLILFIPLSIGILTGCINNSKTEVNTDVDVVRIKKSPPLPVVQSNSPKEIEYMDRPFIGVTTDGHIEEGLFSIKATGISTKRMQGAVNAFLLSLNDDQRAQCTFPVDDNEWRKWHNIDSYGRAGIALFDLDAHQFDLAFAILDAGLSEQGVSKAKSIMAMEEYLKEISTQMGNREQWQIDMLGSDKYWFTFMGSPSATEPWGWQIDGHHLVVNFFVLGDQVVMTPTFMGSELTHIKEGPNAGIRTFIDEGRKGLDLYRSFDEKQRRQACLSEEKDQNFVQAEAFRDNAVLPYTGISANSFNDSQKELLLDLIREYVGNMTDEHSAVKMKEVQDHLNDTWFGWAGGSEDDDVIYYRIHSPVILIEYDHQKPVFIVEKGITERKPVNFHVHTIVRTPNGNDYGKDLLRQHLEEHHHGDHVHHH